MIQRLYGLITCRAQLKSRQRCLKQSRLRLRSWTRPRAIRKSADLNTTMIFTACFAFQLDDRNLNLGARGWRGKVSLKVTRNTAATQVGEVMEHLLGTEGPGKAGI